MAVAKRHRRGKPEKTEQRKGRRTGVRTLGKTTSLASPIYIGQAWGRRKELKKRGQNWARGQPSHLKDVFSFLFSKASAIVLASMSVGQ